MIDQLTEEQKKRILNSKKEFAILQRFEWDCGCVYIDLGFSKNPNRNVNDGRQIFTVQELKQKIEA